MQLLCALLLSGIILTVGLSVALPDATLVAGGLTITAAAVGLALVNRSQRIIAGVLIGLGVCGCFFPCSTCRCRCPSSPFPSPGRCCSP
ncbi:hypothetical protein [Cryobacterium ruanii]|uniref:Uncharacterized protein n=1 Tax=Cryobacterium ruanii TaxID=1259197 RepID=A0A4R9AK55_9MICO|nr:hypothetical protein [Cryobacterium ruanii]TFD63565.1 hypothetical protein E3T47_13925 [Cryobacterium ruanii]